MHKNKRTQRSGKKKGLKNDVILDEDVFCIDPPNGEVKILDPDGYLSKIRRRVVRVEPDDDEPDECEGFEAPTEIELYDIHSDDPD